MILFITGLNNKITFKSWVETLDETKLGKVERKILFPKSDEYEIYNITREYAIKPMVTTVDKDNTLKYLVDGYITKYIVE